jgi:hypothetical protein
MGLVGLGVAYGISFWASTLMMATLVLRGGAGFVPTFRVRPSWILFYRILSVGLVACCLAAIANLTTILVTAQLKVHGPAAVAAYGISARLEFLMIPVAFGVGSALTALVGKAVGAGDWATARRTAWAGGALAFTVTSTMGALVGLFPSTFASAFTQDLAVLAVATRALGFIGPAFGGIRPGYGALLRIDGSRPHARALPRCALPHRARRRRWLGAGERAGHGHRRSISRRRFRYYRLWADHRLVRAARSLGQLAIVELNRFAVVS